MWKRLRTSVFMQCSEPYVVVEGVSATHDYTFNFYFFRHFLQHGLDNFITFKLVFLSFEKSETPTGIFCFLISAVPFSRLRVKVHLYNISNQLLKQYCHGKLILQKSFKENLIDEKYRFCVILPF